MKPHEPLRIAVWGSTGATGSEVIRQAAGDSRIDRITAVTRRPLGVQDTRVDQVVCEDFLDLSSIRGHLVGLHAVFWCLGALRSEVPDERRYREITCEYTMRAARALVQESPGTIFHFVSAMGADPSGQSRRVWARAKGETERALRTVVLGRVVVWRPAFIHPFRANRKDSMAIRLSLALMPLLRLVPGGLNTTVDIAHAMLHETFEPGRRDLLKSWDINRIARRSRSHSPVARDANRGQRISQDSTSG